MVKVAFWKMHGLGNDYIVVDNREGVLPEEKMSRIAERLCRRRYSIGADGLLLLCESDSADVKMRVFNADGGEAEMCGNGIRCLAKYCYEEKVTHKEVMKIETLAGVKTAWLDIENERVQKVKVDMGKPSFRRKDIPMLGTGKCIDQELRLDGESFRVTCLSMGNPHCVLFVDNVDEFPVLEIGPKIERHPAFPNRTNTEFVQITKKNEVRVRVWERGCGETMACGTGACASVVAGNVLGLLDKRCVVHLLGGDLEIEYADVVKMKGDAEKTFEGVVEM